MHDYDNEGTRNENAIGDILEGKRIGTRSSCATVIGWRTTMLEYMSGGDLKGRQQRHQTRHSNPGTVTVLNVEPADLVHHRIPRVADAAAWL